MKYATIAIASLIAVGAAPPPAHDFDALGRDLRDVRAFAANEGDQLWPGYGEAPFGFLMVAGDDETLLCQEPMPDGFQPIGKDAATGCAKYHRDGGGLPSDILASFPIFSTTETIAMGTPEATWRTRGEWLRTVLHEHFHQFEATFPGSRDRISHLALGSGPHDGMWMLNFPFPYASPAVDAAYAKASIALADAVDARGTTRFLAFVDRYLAQRKAFEGTVTAREWRYFDFELWKEGTARWTEIALGERYPDLEVRTAAIAAQERDLARLRAPDLKGEQRETAYPLGAGEATILDTLDPDWRKGFASEVAMGPLLAAARMKADRGHTAR